MQVKIRVVCNAAAFAIKKGQNGYIVYVTKLAQKGEANKELEKRFKKELKLKASVLFGHKNRDKVIEIEGDEKEISQLLERFCKN